MNNKVPAFTLLEVTVAMLLAVIAVGISYTAFTMISSSYRTYDRRNRNLSELLLADKLLKKDFLEAATVTRAEEGLRIDKPGGAVEYRISDSMIIRNQFGLRTDTFKLEVKEAVCTFEKAESVAGARVDKLSLRARVEKEPFSLSYTKLYSSANLTGLSIPPAHFSNP